MATASVSGLATGLDTTSIIQGLLAGDQLVVTNLQSSQTQDQQDLAIFQTIDANLTALQSATTPLAQTQNSVFDTLNVASSDQTQVTASASSNAAPGVYTLNVNQLAQAQEIASQGFNSQNGAITQGTIQIQVGSGAISTITIDNTNDSLQGLASAINASGVGVTASIVNDGSGPGTQAYRLLLSSNQTGADNAITLTNSLAADGGGAVKPVLDATYIGSAVTSASYTGTSSPTTNAGAGGYTGSSNNTYQFTVVNGGTVGTDNGITLSYSDSTGADTGTITLNSGDAGAFKAVAQGLQVQFNAGTLIAGQKFSVQAFVPNVQQAANASVSLGSGAGALTVQSDTNQLDNVINGVTLNLIGTGSQPVKLTVSSNTQQISQDITNFVSAYNAVLQGIDSQSTFDSTTNTAGVLLGNANSSSIEQQVRNALSNAVAGINPQLNNLGALGISTNSDGTLSVNQTQLNAVLSGQVAGVTVQDVQRLFAFTGTSTNSGVQFVTASSSTKPSATGYQVQQTQAATQASITATNPLAASTLIDGTNDTFSINVDGENSGPLTLAHGTYTPQQLAQEVASEINSASGLEGDQVSASLSGNQLALTSSSYGRSSQITIGSGSALSALGFTGTESATGQDAVGNFLVNGVVEPAVGTGQFLIGDATNTNTAGLEVQSTLTPAQIPASGSVATVSVTQGLASQLNSVLTNLLDPVTGLLTTVDDGYNQNIASIQQQINQQNALILLKQQNLQQQFAALESTVSQLQTIGSFLSSQFTSATSTKSSSSLQPTFGTGSTPTVSTGSTTSSGTSA